MSRGRAGGILGASATTALSTLLITMLAANTLSAAHYAEFLVFWSLLFGIFGIVSGLQGEATRAVGTAHLHPGGHRGVRVLASGAALSGAVAVLVVISSPAWSHRLVGSTTPWVVPLIAFGVLAYGCYQSLVGASAGLNHWNQFSALMIIDGVARLVLVAGAALLIGSLWSIEAAVVAAGLVWLVVPLVAASGREALTARADVGLRASLVRSGLAMLSSTSTAILITGFPVLMRLTGPNEDPVVMSGTMTAISLTRSPIMIPLQAFQGVAIASFLRQGTRSLQALIRPMLILLGLGVLAAPLAGWVGPWVLDVLYGGLTFPGDTLTFAGLMFAAAPLAMLTLSGTAVLALDQHRAFAAGWLVAALIACLLLLLPVALQLRVVVALLAGPTVGIAIHLLAIRRRSVAATDRA